MAAPPASVPPATVLPGAVVSPEEDIRDIRPPFHIPSNLPWLIGAAGAAALAAASYGVWRWTRKRARKLEPYEIALEKLEATRPLMRSETTREFCIAVSEIVRAFIEECFPVRAAHRTTDEFLHELATQPDSPLAAHHEALALFLDHCDLAKFARWNLPEWRVGCVFDRARDLILSIAQPAAQPSAPASEPVRHSDVVIRHSPAPQS
jgi:HAMP domain-containing protein